MFSSSSNCGATWSNPAKLSERIALNQGTVLAVNPVDGAIYIAWREFANPADPTAAHAILFVRSTDGGKSFTKAAPIDNALRPFDQGDELGQLPDQRLSDDGRRWHGPDLRRVGGARVCGVSARTASPATRAS